VGRSDLRSVESLLLQAFMHMLKAEAWPNSLSVPTWQSDALLFRAQARRAFSPSMRQRIDVGELYTMRHRLQTKAGKQRYALRKQTPES
jgi:hypothetical protein